MSTRQVRRDRSTGTGEGRRRYVTSKDSGKVDLIERESRRRKTEDIESENKRVGMDVTPTTPSYGTRVLLTASGRSLLGVVGRKDETHTDSDPPIRVSSLSRPETFPCRSFTPRYLCIRVRRLVLFRSQMSSFCPQTGG